MMRIYVYHRFVCIPVCMLQVVQPGQIWGLPGRGMPSPQQGIDACLCACMFVCMPRTYVCTVGECPIRNGHADISHNYICRCGRHSQGPCCHRLLARCHHMHICIYIYGSHSCDGIIKQICVRQSRSYHGASRPHAACYNCN